MKSKKLVVAFIGSSQEYSQLRYLVENAFKLIYINEAEKAQGLDFDGVILGQGAELSEDSKEIYLAILTRIHRRGIL